jgi:hypothetical protein
MWRYLLNKEMMDEDLLSVVRRMFIDAFFPSDVVSEVFDNWAMISSAEG